MSSKILLISHSFYFLGQESSNSAFLCSYPRDSPDLKKGCRIKFTSSLAVDRTTASRIPHQSPEHSDAVYSDAACPDDLPPPSDADALQYSCWSVCRFAVTGLLGSISRDMDSLSRKECPRVFHGIAPPFFWAI